jgi:hypothetical protein
MPLSRFGNTTPEYLPMQRRQVLQAFATGAILKVTGGLAGMSNEVAHRHWLSGTTRHSGICPDTRGSP